MHHAGIASRVAMPAKKQQQPTSPSFKYKQQGSTHPGASADKRRSGLS